MKSRYISSVVIVITGAAIGMIMASFSTNSIGAGAVFGAGVGLFITVWRVLLTRQPTSGGETGMG